MTVGTVSGRVLDNLGRPIAGASVYFVRAPVSMPDVALQTDADGRFVFGVRSSGIYRIGVTVPSHITLEHDITVADGRPVSVTLRMGVGE
jgi:hypothetical protein